MELKRRFAYIFKNFKIAFKAVRLEGRWNVDFTYLNGECGNDVRLRVLNFLSDVILKPYKYVAVVCHGGVIRSIFCYLLGMEQHKRFRINPSNCGISCIEYIENFKVITINEILHLMGYQ